MPNPDHEKHLQFARDIAKRAGDITLKYFQTNPTIETKSDNTPVTIADRAAEEFLRTEIERQYPTHGILGEEFGEKPGRDPARWILDPIDGTYSFICGVPLYATLIALEWENELVVGVIHLPALRESIAAARGHGCYWNDARCHVSQTKTLSDARLCHTGTRGFLQTNRESHFRRLRDACRADRGWSDAYAYALVATGRADIAIDPILSLWDIAPMYAIITEAGGRITDWNGNANPHAPEAIATNGHIHDKTIQLVITS